MRLTLLMLILACFGNSCSGQTKPKHMIHQAHNPLLCDTATGMCVMPTAQKPAEPHTVRAKQKPVKLIYFTDPICSSCWGIEPQLRRLKLEYGNSLDIEYRMGGLLPDWSYNSGGISKPSDVAQHWDEVSAHYDMPIDGDVWLEDPLSSSYPPSIAVKAAQMQDREKAVRFLRELRELLFLRKKNITRWEHIADAASKAGLDTAQLKKDFDGNAKALFAADLEMAQRLGVRGFPTIFFTDTSGKQDMVYGTKPYAAYEQAIVRLLPTARKQAFAGDWQSLFSRFPSLSAREFSELSGTPRSEADAYLHKLEQQGRLERTASKNGPLWRLK